MSARRLPNKHSHTNHTCNGACYPPHDPTTTHQCATCQLPQQHNQPQHMAETPACNPTVTLTSSMPHLIKCTAASRSFHEHNPIASQSPSQQISMPAMLPCRLGCGTQPATSPPAWLQAPRLAKRYPHCRAIPSLHLSRMHMLWTTRCEEPPCGTPGRHAAPQAQRWTCTAASTAVPPAQGCHLDTRMSPSAQASTSQHRRQPQTSCLSRCNLTLALVCCASCKPRQLLSRSVGCAGGWHVSQQ